MLTEVATYEPSDSDLSTKIEILDNEISKGDHDLSNDIPIERSESENTAYRNEWRT